METNWPSQSVTESELRQAITKESSERLTKELKLGQSYFSNQDIESMSRSELVEQVVTLRKIAGTSSAVKQLVSNFVPSKVSNPSSSDTATVQDTKSGTTGSNADPIFLIAQMMQMQMKAQEMQMLQAKEAQDMQMKAQEMQMMQAKEAQEMQMMQAKEAQEMQMRAQEMQMNAIAKLTETQLEAVRMQTHQANKNHEIDLERAERAERARMEDSNNLTSRLKKAGDITRSFLYAMPESYTSADIAPYFNSIENMLKHNAINEDLWISLVMPYLNSRLKRMVANAPFQEFSDYTTWKSWLLNEIHLTPAVHLSNFNNAARKYDESCSQFVTRLAVLWKYYVESREVSSFDDVCKLIVSDKVKSMLSNDVRQFVLDKQNNEKWQKPESIGKLVDLYENDIVQEQIKNFCASRIIQLPKIRH